MTNEILTTDRTKIRRITLDDAPFFVELVNSEPWVRFIGDRNVGDVEDAEKYLEEGFLRCYEENEFGYYLISTHLKIPIGVVGFLKKPNLDNPDFGFALLPDFFGNGYAFEASNAVLHWGLREFGFKVLDAVTVNSNEPSKKLLGKLGFEYEEAIEQSKEELELYRFKSNR